MGLKRRSEENARGFMPHKVLPAVHPDKQKHRAPCHPAGYPTFSIAPDNTSPAHPEGVFGAGV
jgi:hypothetical protein